MEKRTRRSPARFFAPLALIAVLVAFLMIVNASSTNKSSNAADTDTTTATQTTTTATKKSSTTTTATVKTSAGKTYTVQVGDTLGGIADKTGVPLDRIETLNPNVDPHAMVTGQKIRLK